MRKTLITAVLSGTAALGMLMSGVANAATTVPQSAPYSSSSSDGGTCGNKWAVDLYNRIFSQPTPDPAGNYAIVERFANGHFSTTAGQSPGACNSGTADNGHKVREGLNGTFFGNIHIFIQGGTFDAKDGTCNGFPTSDPANPCTTSTYIAWHYGAAATYTETSYVFTYKTPAADALGTKTWKEFSSNGTSETDTGDIYTS